MASLQEITDEILGPRDIVVVEGADASTYLHSQVSQDLRDQAVGEARWTFVLQPTGKIDALVRATRTTEERFELDTDAGEGEALLARLNRFKIRVKAETSLIPAEFGEPDPSSERSRVIAGWPKVGAEIIPGETIPGGTGLTGIAVSYTKGCYPGQELVERMDSRGANAPKSLRRIDVAEGAVVGDPITDGDDEVGTLTSVSGEIALGWVKRTSDVGEIIEF
jgi:folate-binding protein YgfZ